MLSMEVSGAYSYDPAEGVGDDEERVDRGRARGRAAPERAVERERGRY